jgi:hypothetical protein
VNRHERKLRLATAVGIRFDGFVDGCCIYDVAICSALASNRTVSIFGTPPEPVASSPYPGSVSAGRADKAMRGRRNGYYPAVMKAAGQGISDDPPGKENLAPDPLIGAATIAAALKIRSEQLKSLIYPASRRQRLGAPSRKLPGLGLVAERRELLEWWRSYLSGGLPGIDSAS